MAGRGVNAHIARSTYVYMYGNCSEGKLSPLSSRTTGRGGLHGAVAVWGVQRVVLLL